MKYISHYLENYKHFSNPIRYIRTNRMILGVNGEGIIQFGPRIKKLFFEWGLEFGVGFGQPPFLGFGVGFGTYPQI
jgi:hypothetical protein